MPFRWDEYGSACSCRATLEQSKYGFDHKGYAGNNTGKASGNLMRRLTLGYVHWTTRLFPTKAATSANAKSSLRLAS
jgi:hypothetical protein